MIFGLFAWWLFEDSRAERSLLNAVIAAMFMALGVYGVVMPSLTTLFPSAEVARALRNVVCVGPKAAAAGFHEPSLVFMTDTSTLLTDGSGAADFLAQGNLPLRAGGAGFRAQLPAARRSDRPALQRAGPRRRLQHLAGQGGLDRDLPFGRHGIRCPRRPVFRSPQNYFSRLGWLAWRSVAQLVRAPSHSRRAEAARRSARHGLLLSALTGAAIIALMYVVDVPEISIMPPRGTPSLWPVRILTDFGKDAYVLWSLAGLMVAVALLAPAWQGLQRIAAIGSGNAATISVLRGPVPDPDQRIHEIRRGRGRPFVGGHANAFNFSHFAGTEAYASFPSGHAVTAFALAFAVSALWPRLRIVMILYALLIAATRLVLLAHHPSDVVAGALVGIIGAMVVRYWFAARRLSFAIRADGTIVPLTGPSRDRLKRVAGGAFAP